ncbi:MAG TPA: recombinase RecA [Candidatus Babeliales bacterium]|jgi:recombination protein RecA|nr:recombinase RecA [Candidatus Babeliales bacterium]
MKEKSVDTSSVGAQNSELLFKKKALEVTFAQIDKQYGTGSVMRLGQHMGAQVSVVSTGSLLIDAALGVGGLPRGRVIEIYGPEASGKTTLALHVIAQAQQSGGICAFIDAEHALDPSYASNVGINTDDLIISQPDYGEQALDIAEMLIRSNAIDIIVIDSVAALVPKAELEGDMGDSHMGLQARLMSQALRKLTPIVHKSKTVLIFINQIRQNINAMPFADKETTTGGKALKFYASIRMDVRRIGSIKKGEELIGNHVAIKIAKNKVAPPFKRVEIDLMFGSGFCRELEIIDSALAHGIITKSGAWFAYQDKNVAQGREQMLVYLQENPDIARALEVEVREKMSSHGH